MHRRSQKRRRAPGCHNGSTTTHGTAPVERLIRHAEGCLGGEVAATAGVLRGSVQHKVAREGGHLRGRIREAQVIGSLAGVRGDSFYYRHTDRPSRLVSRANASATKLVMQTRMNDTWDAACVPSAFPHFDTTTVSAKHSCFDSEAQSLLDSLLKVDPPKMLPPESPKRKDLKRAPKVLRGLQRSVHEKVEGARRGKVCVQKRFCGHAKNYVAENVENAFHVHEIGEGETRRRRVEAGERLQRAICAREAVDMEWYNTEATREQERADQRAEEERTVRQRIFLELVCFASTVVCWGSQQQETWRLRDVQRIQHEACLVIQQKFFPCVRHRIKERAFLAGARQTKRNLSIVRQQQRLEEEKKHAMIKLCQHLLTLAAGCVQVRARMARSLFMSRVKCIQRFVRYVVKRKRFQLGMLETYWKYEETFQLQTAKQRNLRKVRCDVQEFADWRAKQKSTERTSRHVHATWSPGLPWDQKSFTLLASLTDMRVQDLPDAEVRRVAIDIGYLERSVPVVPASIRRTVLCEELERRRRTYYAKIPGYKESLRIWTKQVELLAGHVTHESPEMRQRLLNLAGVTEKPPPPLWGVLPCKASLLALLAHARKLAHKSNPAFTAESHRESPAEKRLSLSTRDARRSSADFLNTKL